MPGVVAYTFDDGPGIYNDLLLSKLASKNVTATFFVLGSMIAANTDGLKKILDHGHQLASHTYTHRSLDDMSVGLMQQEMNATADIMFKYSGIRPRYMRAPEGRCEKTCLKVMADLGYVVTHWNVDTNDWRYKDEKNPQVAVNKSMKEVNEAIVKKSDPAKDSFIILQHEIHKFSVEYLVDAVVDAVQKKGYRFVSIEECIGKPAYMDGSVVPATSHKHTHYF
ncbi:chitin deacetylase [Modicella reniformis]|uniref:Chitin deacetylase n=1 Tax=Modicella reniformis TaxID=1440133 RepID=A0A9P6SVB0_9FUNG|nr:chitin deacetylase [Modicella reniformis]